MERRIRWDSLPVLPAGGAQHRLTTEQPAQCAIPDTAPANRLPPPDLDVTIITKPRVTDGSRGTPVTRTGGTAHMVTRVTPAG